MEKNVNMDMLSVKEVACMLSVTPRTVQRWISDGRLIAYRLGERKIQIKKEDLEKFIESSRIEEVKRMTFETVFNVPAQLIMNGEVIDVMVQSVSTRDEESPIVHEEKYKDSVGKLFVEPHIIGKNVQTITTFHCVKIENKRVF